MKLWIKMLGVGIGTVALIVAIDRLMVKILKVRIRKEIQSLPTELLLAGLRFTPTDAERQEVILATNQENLNARGLLLGYYGRPFAGTADRKKFQAHSLWIIEHKPLSPLNKLTRLTPDDDDASYEKGKKLWLDHCRNQQENIEILTNAAQYFLIFDRELAESCLQKGKTLEPYNRDLAKRLAQVYDLGLEHLDYSESKRRALQEQERALALSRDPLEIIFMLLDLPELAFQAGEFEKAANYSHRLLEDASKENPIAPTISSDGTHRAHTFLGQIALIRGDIEQAKRHLKSSCEVAPSPVLKSFGPKFDLAKTLLEAGERSAVIDYLDGCAEFWKNNRGRLARWRSEIENRQMPEEWSEE